MTRIPVISWQTQIVDPETGRPTQAFLTAWDLIRRMALSDLEDVGIPSDPADGQVLTYSAAEKKWTAS